MVWKHVFELSEGCQSPGFCPYIAMSLVRRHPLYRNVRHPKKATNRLGASSPSICPYVYIALSLLRRPAKAFNRRGLSSPFIRPCLRPHLRPYTYSDMRLYVRPHVRPRASPHVRPFHIRRLRRGRGRVSRALVCVGGPPGKRPPWATGPTYLPTLTRPKKLAFS